MIKLTKKDKEYLTNLGVNNRDFSQIEEATEKTVYELENDLEISREKAIEILGRNTYLSGIARSAFHFTAMRHNSDESIAVYFDSGKLFEGC